MILLALLSFQFTQECVYKYASTQYSFGENEREEITFSTDVHWRCESSENYMHITISHMKRYNVALCKQELIALMASFHNRWTVWCTISQ